MSTLDDLNALQASIAESVLGQDHVIRQILLGLLANGHLLLESLPGLAKTRTVKALSKHLDAQMRRIRRFGTLGGLGQRHERYPKPRALADEAAADDQEIRTESAASASEKIPLLLR